MSLIFQVKGTALNAFVSNTGKAPYLYAVSNSVPAVVSLGDATVFGGQAIDCIGVNTSPRALIYDGSYNVASLSNTNGAFSFILRIVPNWTGAPAVDNGLMSFSNGYTDTTHGFYDDLFELSLTTAGKIHCYFGRTGGAIVSVVGTATKTNWVAGQAYDICFSWDGTVAAGKMKVSIDGVEFDTFTPSFASTIDPLKCGVLALGTNMDFPKARFRINEFVMFDTNINHVYAVRTGFYSSSAFDGQVNTDPGIANVRNGTGYSIAGTALTGTAAIPTAANVRSGTATDATTGSLAVPAASSVRSGTAVDAGTGTLDLPSIANVKTGVAFDGASQTGTYDGSDRWTDPGIANVRSGTGYKANSTSNNRTGTAAIPVASNVRSGTSTDATTGTLAVPAASNVRNGTAVDAGTGTAYIPAAANVRLGTNVDATTGTAAIPTAANVRSGTATDATTGTLNVPAAANVRLGTAVDAGAGTLDLPSVGNVKTGVVFDGTTKTGTYDGSDRWSDPGAANVRLATAYKANSTSNNQTGSAAIPGASSVKIGVATDATTGSYDGSDRWTDAGESNVRISTAYKANSLANNKTGTLQPVLNTMQEMVLDGPENSTTRSAETVLTLTQGDEVTLNFKLMSMGEPVSLTGGVFETKILGHEGMLVLADDVHTPNADQFGHKGELAIAVTSHDTFQMLLGEEHDVVVKVTQGGSVLHFNGIGLLTVRPASPAR